MHVPGTRTAPLQSPKRFTQTSSSCPRTGRHMSTPSLVLGTPGISITASRRSSRRSPSPIPTAWRGEGRGITIELGFAQLTLPAAHDGCVDVPVTRSSPADGRRPPRGIDVVLLVVAAMTASCRRHVSTWRSSTARHPRGVVAITKADLADATGSTSSPRTCAAHRRHHHRRRAHRAGVQQDRCGPARAARSHRQCRRASNARHANLRCASRSTASSRSPARAPW